MVEITLEKISLDMELSMNTLRDILSISLKTDIELVRRL